MAASEPCLLSVEGASDLLDLADDLDCHLDLADISDDWVSLMMQDPDGLDSASLPPDLSFSHISCLEVEQGACHEQQQQENAGFCSQHADAKVLWAEMEARGPSVQNLPCLSKEGSDCDASFAQTDGSLLTSFSSMSRFTSSNSSSASPASSELLSLPGDPCPWPSYQSSLMGTATSSSFLVDLIGNTDSLPDQHVADSVSEVPRIPVGVVRETSCNAAASSCQFHNGQTDGAAPVCLSSSGQAEFFAESLPQVSGNSSSIRECDGNELIQEILLDREFGSEGSDSDSPTSLIFPAQVEGVDPSAVNGAQSREKWTSQQEVGQDSVGGKVEAFNGSSSPEPEQCKASVERDASCSQDSQERSSFAALQSRSAARGEGKRDAKSDPGKEQLSKGTKRKGDDRWAPKQSVSTCSEGQNSEVSDADKKEFTGEGGDDEDQKRQARLMRNRESAQQSRQRKKVYVDELEHKLRTMTATVAELNATIAHLSAENVNLRRQICYIYQPHPALGARPPVMAPPSIPVGPYPGMYGIRPMIPGALPLPVPIPRLKSQSSASKPTKKPKVSAKNEGVDRKRKRKAAGAAVLGLFCFMILIGPYSWRLPQPENRHTGVWGDRNSMSRPGGRVLNSWIENEQPRGFWWWLTLQRWLDYWRQSSKTSEEICHLTCVPSVQKRHSRSSSASNFLDKPVPQRGAHRNKAVDVSHIRNFKARQPLQKKWVDEGERGAGSSTKELPSNSQTSGARSPVAHVGGLLLANASEPFAASLRVPRNNQLVTIEGRLILQAVMAGDEAAERDLHMRGNDKGKESHDKVLAEVLGHHMGKRQERSKVTVQGVGHELQNGVYREASSERQHGVPDKALVRAIDGAKVSAIAANQGATYSSTDLPALTTGDDLSRYILDDVTGLGLRAGICKEIFTFDAVPGQVGEDADSNSTEVSGGLQNETRNNEGRSRRKRDPFAIPLPPSLAQTSGLTNKSDNGTISADDGFVGQKHRSSVVVSIFTGPQGTEDEAITVCDRVKGRGNLFVVVLVDGLKYVTYSCCLPAKLEPQVVAG